MKTRILKAFNQEAQRVRYFPQYRSFFIWRTIKKSSVVAPTCSYSGGYLTENAAELVLCAFLVEQDTLAFDTV